MITAITIRNEQELNRVKAKLIEGGFDSFGTDVRAEMVGTFTFLRVADGFVDFNYSNWPCDMVMSANNFLEFPKRLCGWKVPESAPKKMTVAEVCEKLGYEVEIVK